MPTKHLDAETAPAMVTHTARRLGENVRIARQRRGLPQSELAARAGISRPTLVRMEGGTIGTGLGAWLSVLWVLGLLDRVSDVAAPGRDEEGLALEAARRGKRVRQRKPLSDDF